MHTFISNMNLTLLTYCLFFLVSIVFDRFFLFCALFCVVAVGSDVLQVVAHRIASALRLLLTLALLTFYHFWFIRAIRAKVGGVAVLPVCHFVFALDVFAFADWTFLLSGRCLFQIIMIIENQKNKTNQQTK